MFKRGDRVKVCSNPEAPYIPQQLSLDEVYVVAEVKTDFYSADEETGMPEEEHTVVRFQGEAPDKWEEVVHRFTEDECIVVHTEHMPEEWYDANYFVLA